MLIIKSCAKEGHATWVGKACPAVRWHTEVFDWLKTNELQACAASSENLGFGMPSLTYRIAKRKASGWSLGHEILRQDRAVAPNPRENERSHTNVIQGFLICGDANVSSRDSSGQDIRDT